MQTAGVNIGVEDLLTSSNESVHVFNHCLINYSVFQFSLNIILVALPSPPGGVISES